MRTVTKEEFGKIADRYWQARFSHDSEAVKRIKAEMNECILLPDVTINSRGNVVERSHSAYHDRYAYDFDFCRPSFGWQQFDTDQDASYFGAWVNKRMLKTLTYAEGDLIVVTCPDPHHYNLEIMDMCRFYGVGFIAKSYDEAGVTIYRQDRNDFFIKYIGR